MTTYSATHRQINQAHQTGRYPVLDTVDQSNLLVVGVGNKWIEVITPDGRTDHVQARDVMRWTTRPERLVNIGLWAAALMAPVLSAATLWWLK